MGYVLVAAIFSFIIQLSVCLTDLSGIGKLMPLLLEAAAFLTLVILFFSPLRENFSTDARFMMAFYGFLVFIGMAANGLAWLVYAVKKKIYDY